MIVYFRVSDKNVLNDKQKGTETTRDRCKNTKTQLHNSLRPKRNPHRISYERNVLTAKGFNMNGNKKLRLKTQFHK